MQEPAQNIIWIIVIITSIFLIAAVFLLLYVKLYNDRKKKYAEEKTNMIKEFEKQLLQSQIEVQEATFSELGKELHDNIGQLLSTTKMLIGITEMNLQEIPETLTSAHETIGIAIHELRTLSKSLSKEWLEQFDFIENLNTVILRLNNNQSCKVHFIHPGKLPLVADQQIILLRIIQEGIQNAVKHSKAKNLFITIEKEFNSLSLSVKDDGIGIVDNSTRNGIGILNMKHRVKLLGGSIELNSIPGKGTEIMIKLPTQQEDYEN